MSEAQTKPWGAMRAWWERFKARGEYPRMCTIEEQMWHRGRDAGIKDGRAWGYREGYDAGLKEGYDRGYRHGIQEASRLLKAGTP